MKLFDLHCDTATRLLSERQELYSNSLHIDLKRAEKFEKYAQVMAVWTDKRLSDAEGYSKFFEVAKNLKKETEAYGEFCALVSNGAELADCASKEKSPLILAVEDARILGNDINRLDALYSCGVRVLTLNWYGLTCIGGAHDTDVGLSEFGISVVKRCFELGIIPDISHSSFKGASAALELAEEYSKPVIASHSDSYTVNPHSRNLKDEDFTKIVNLNGLVGINLCPTHLSANGNASLCDVIKHIEHYLSLDGEKTLAMGFDLDGTNLPRGFYGIEDVYKIADELQRLNYPSRLIDGITYNNAYNFFTKYI